MSIFGFLPKSRMHADDEGGLAMKNIMDDIKMMVNADVKICLFFNFLSCFLSINSSNKRGRKKVLLTNYCFNVNIIVKVNVSP